MIRARDREENIYVGKRIMETNPSSKSKGGKPKRTLLYAVKGDVKVFGLM